MKVANSNCSEKRFREWDLQKAFSLFIKPRLDSNIFLTVD